MMRVIWMKRLRLFSEMKNPPKMARKRELALLSISKKLLKGLLIRGKKKKRKKKHLKLPSKRSNLYDLISKTFIIFYIKYYYIIIFLANN
jgi:hypothetical protein